jgi:hypothetical protein
MSHSSKSALAFASSLGFPEIVAAGFSPILQEALARGASGCYPMPLCDDPLEQISFFPKDEFSNIIVGENPDWVFSGASLCGAIVGTKRFDLAQKLADFPQRSVLLIPDSGEEKSNIDIRRINLSSSSSASAFEMKRNATAPMTTPAIKKDLVPNLEIKIPSGVIGNSTFAKSETKRSELVTGTPSEIVSSLTRRIRRMVE